MTPTIDSGPEFLWSPMLNCNMKIPPEAEIGHETKTSSVNGNCRELSVRSISSYLPQKRPCLATPSRLGSDTPENTIKWAERGMSGTTETDSRSRPGALIRGYHSRDVFLVFSTRGGRGTILCVHRDFPMYERGTRRACVGVPAPIAANVQTEKGIECMVSPRQIARAGGWFVCVQLSQWGRGKSPVASQCSEDSVADIIVAI